MLFMIILIVTSCSKQQELIENINSGNQEKIKALIANGIDLNYNDDTSSGNIPLHCAVKKGNLPIVKLLVDSGADINQSNLYHTTPIELAVKFNKLGIAEYLISSGADIHYLPPKSNNSHASKTLLSLATVYDGPEMVKLLIKNKIDVNAQDRDGRTALWYLAEEICMYYPELKDDKYGVDYLTTLKILITEGADVNIGDKLLHGTTPLMGISGSGSIECVNILLKAGANVNAIAGTNLVALDIATTRNHSKIIALLRKHGAKSIAEINKEKSNKKDVLTPPPSGK